MHIDVNNDNKVSKNEYMRWFQDSKHLRDRVVKDWNDADKNKDGFLTKEEYTSSPMAKYAKKKMGKAAPMAEFNRMDRSKQGKVSRDDFEWYVSPDDFGSGDRNNDGFLSLEEFKIAPFHFHDYEGP